MEQSHSKGLVRRRVYLSRKSIDYLDTLARMNGMTTSILLDNILLNMVEKERTKGSINGSVV